MAHQVQLVKRVTKVEMDLMGCQVVLDHQEIADPQGWMAHLDYKDHKACQV